MSISRETTYQRLHIVVQGVVQGVGFRPFVYTQALRLGLSGFVLNNSVGVVIEVEGAEQALACFQRALHEEAPPLARIVAITCERVPLRHESGFVIIHSEAGAERRALISPDTATCTDCLHEIDEPSDRRYQCGEQAIHQPWRMGAVYLAQTYGDAFLALDIPFVRQLDRSKWRVLSQMIAKGINCPQTSSMGRLFDVVAALLNLQTEVLYEGQAAIELESLATMCTDRVTSYPFLLHPGQPMRLDGTSIIDAVVKDIIRGVSAATIARRFHVTVTEMLAATCYDVHKQTGLSRVALSGGVFQNQLLLEQLVTRLETMEFEVYINRRVPPNDGGLSLGQLAVAAARLQKGV